MSHDHSAFMGAARAIAIVAIASCMRAGMAGWDHRQISNCFLIIPRG